MKQKIKQRIINIVFYITLSLTVIALLKIFVFSSFRVPTMSMEPEVIPGDYILVNKLAYGARLFDLFAASAHKRVDIYRVPGFSKVKRNDIVVFNNPYPNTDEKLEMDIMQYYIKRCLAVPGDTIAVQNSFYFANGNTTDTLGNRRRQIRLSITADSILQKEKLYTTYPYDSTLAWNVKNFGPLYVPKKGDSLQMNAKNSKLYYKLIAWEKNKELFLENDTIWENKTTPILHYVFTHNYYFMVGDNVSFSKDSRYWGLLPDDYIVGKAWIVWQSITPIINKRRNYRYFKKLR